MTGVYPVALISPLLTPVIVIAGFILSIVNTYVSLLALINVGFISSNSPGALGVHVINILILSPENSINFPSLIISPHFISVLEMRSGPVKRSVGSFKTYLSLDTSVNVFAVPQLAFKITWLILFSPIKAAISSRPFMEILCPVDIGPQKWPIPG